MALITGIFVLLVTAHVFGHLSSRVGLPKIAGHMLAGIVIGPSIAGWVEPLPGLGAVSDIAVLFIVLTAGLEMRMQHVVEVFRGRGVGALLIGFFVPLATAAAIALAFSLAPIPATVVALCMAVTALPVALQILSGFQLLGSQLARVAISGALLADIIVFIVLGLLIELSLSEQETTWVSSISLAAAKLLGLIAAIVLSHHVCLRVVKRNRSRQELSIGESTAKLTFVLLFVLGLGALSEALGFHFAIGAFFAAMMISAELIGERPFERLEGTCEVLTASLFGPLFMAYQGMQFQLESLSHPGFAAALLIGSIASKLIGGYMVGRLQRMDAHEAWGVGIVMNAHGVMELVVAAIALNAGLIDRGLFSTLLAVGMTTTVLTPVMLKRWHVHSRLVADVGESPSSN
jgi:Kef-type K+ transport system membrane component KefB